MRGFKALWRFALGKRQGKPATGDKHAKPCSKPESVTTDFQNPVHKLLSADPPTKTLQ